MSDFAAGRNRRPSSDVLADAIAGWLASEALGNSKPADLFDGMCRRLRAAGVPVLRGNVTFNVLHPLYSAGALIWTAVGVDVQLMARDSRDSGAWQASPIRYVLAHGLPLLRRRLTGRTALLDFPVLEEFRAGGGHDYLLLSIRFDEPARAAPARPEQGGIAQVGIEFRDRRGIVCSWVGDRPSGFTDGEIGVLQRLTSRLAVALKARLERAIADNVASAYLGRLAGEAVLSGSIHRGDGEKIGAALWYSDLRHSTTLAAHDTAEGFLRVLNRYFEMTAGAIHDQGGEVVSFIGDAVLGFFRVDGSTSDACTRALEAAIEARRRLAVYEPEAGTSRIEFGIGLHLGEVIYGNVGVPDRLQFTLVGSAVNEVARIEDLTKTLGCAMVASAAFARAAQHPWQSLGVHALRGIAEPTEIFSACDAVTEPAIP